MVSRPEVPWFGGKCRKGEFWFEVHILQTPKPTCWMGRPMKPPPGVHSPASHRGWWERRKQCGAGTGGQALPSLCICPPALMPQLGNKPGIHAPAVPSLAGPKHPGHPLHHTSGIRRLLAAMPACSWVHLSHTVPPQEKQMCHFPFTGRGAALSKYKQPGSICWLIVWTKK